MGESSQLEEKIANGVCNCCTWPGYYSQQKRLTPDFIWVIPDKSQGSLLTALRGLAPYDSKNKDVQLLRPPEDRAK